MCWRFLNCTYFQKDQNYVSTKVHMPFIFKAYIEHHLKSTALIYKLSYLLDGSFLFFL